MLLPHSWFQTTMLLSIASCVAEMAGEPKDAELV
jgi:hypothetical protein